MSNEVSNDAVVTLQKNLDEAKFNLNVSQQQVLAHQEVINGLMNENLNLRTNFKLSQNGLSDSLKANQVLNAMNQDLRDKVDSLTKELESLKNPPAAEESAAVMDANVEAA